MAEYIEREAAIEKLNKLCDRVCQYSKAQRKYMCGACPLGDAFTVIEDDIPAADVRPALEGRHEGNQAHVPPVVRGKWIDRDDDYYGWNMWACSACGEEFVLTEGTPDMNDYHFCPNCGADMREEQDGR